MPPICWFMPYILFTVQRLGSDTMDSASWNEWWKLAKNTTGCGDTLESKRDSRPSPVNLESVNAKDLPPHLLSPRVLRDVAVHKPSGMVWQPADDIHCHNGPCKWVWREKWQTVQTCPQLMPLSERCHHDIISPELVPRVSLTPLTWRYSVF